MSGKHLLDADTSRMRRRDEQHVLHNSEDNRRYNVVVVVARNEQNQEDNNVLHDGNTGADIRDDIVAVMRAENDTAVREEEVARRRVNEVNDIENVQVYVRRNRSVNKTVKKREHGKSAEENHRAHAAINGAVELEVRAEELPVVVRHRLVHRADDGRTEAKLGEHEDAEN